MIRRPDTSDTLVDTRNGLLGALQFLPTSLLKQVRLHQYLLWLEISNTYRLLAAVNILASNNGVLVRPWGNSDFDLGVCFGEVGESASEEGTIGSHRLESSAGIAIL